MSSDSSFYFLGRGPGSKSLINRAWIVKSYYPDFQIAGASSCEDSVVIEQAVKSLRENKEIFCGQSASALRFMALRASRKKGCHTLTGSQQLFSRPHHSLIKILSQLGVAVQILDRSIVIQSEGWKPQGDALSVPMDVSSQFASAVFLNGWQLEKDLFISLEGPPVSLSYLDMTLSFLKSAGLGIEGQFPEFKILKNSCTSKNLYTVEPDMSNLFTLACFASLRGQAVFTPWAETSLQPDFVFPEILQKMGVPVERVRSSLKISSADVLKPISIQLNSNPDMFPCLAVLCCLAEGESHLYGVSHLAFKESHRLQQTAYLLKHIRRRCVLMEDGLRIKGGGCRKPKRGFNVEKNHLSAFYKKNSVYGEEGMVFDPKEDHRMAMAGALALYAGFRIKVKNPSCVNKSFPDFWKIVFGKNSQSDGC